MRTTGTAKFMIALAKAAISEAEEALTLGQDDSAWAQIDYAVDKLKEALDLI